MPDLTPRLIETAELAQVYPLIRSATRASLDRWEAFARDLFLGGGGVLAIEAPDKCIHGIAAFRPNRHLRHELALDVEILIAFDLGGDNQVRETLYWELERIAANLHCETVNISIAARVAGPKSRIRAGLERLGLNLETASFVRELSGPGRGPKSRNRSR